MDQEVAARFVAWTGRFGRPRLPGMKRTKATQPPALPAIVKPQAKGPERWHPGTLTSGHWIKLPKALIKGTGRLKLKPHHVWLLIALELDKFSNRPPRYFWAQLADWAGCDKKTIARWARELRERGFLTYRQRWGKDQGQVQRLGYHNDRNEFTLDKGEKKILEVHAELEAEKKKWRSRNAPD